MTNQQNTVICIAQNNWNVVTWDVF